MLRNASTGGSRGGGGEFSFTNVINVHGAGCHISYFSPLALSLSGK